MAKTMAELLALFPNNQTILDAAIKTEDHITSQAQQGGKIMISSNRLGTVGMELFRATSCYPLDAPTGTADGGMTTNT